MYEIRVSAAFDAAHFLRDYAGKCSRVHGHTFTVEVALRGEELGPDHLLVDFLEVKSALSRLLEAYDHACLNEVEPFDELSPTSENLARVLYERLEPEVRSLGRGVSLAGVRVSESPNACAAYFPHP